MKLHDIQEIERNLEKLIKKNKLRNKQVVVFGALDSAEVVHCYLAKYRYKVSYVANNDKKLHGCFVNGLGIEVLPPDALFHSGAKGYVVVIASGYYSEMLRQLQAYGFKENRDVFKLAEYHYAVPGSVSLPIFLKSGVFAIKGGLLYEKIRKEHGLPRDGKVYVCGYPALGDVYLVCAYIKQYAVQCGISDWVLVVQGGIYRDIAAMFSIKKVHVLPEQARMRLIAYSQVCGEGAAIEVMCLSMNRINKMSELFGYHGIHLMDLYASALFSMPGNTVPSIPKKPDKITYAQKLVRNGQLKPGKTVILFPYAYSTPNLQSDVWQHIAAELNRRGYTVFTNAANVTEAIIEGTTAVCCPIAETVAFVEYAGGVIMNRSGMCELVSSARCKKAVIYTPKQSNKYGNPFEYFSLKRMGLCDDVVEIDSLEYADPYELAKKAVGIFGNVAKQ